VLFTVSQVFFPVLDQKYTNAMLTNVKNQQQQRHNTRYDVHHDQHAQECRRCECWKDSVAMTPTYERLFSSFVCLCF